MYVIDLEGNEYPAQATSTKELELNGNQALSAVFVSNKVNDSIPKLIEEARVLRTQ